MKFDGKDVTTMRGLPKIVAQAPIGKAVEVEVLRKGESKKLSVTVGLLEEDEVAAAPEEGAPAQGPAPVTVSILGMKLTTLTDDSRLKYNLEAKVQGILVDDVDASSPAAQKGLKPGDVIIEAAEETVSKPEDLAKAVEKMKAVGRKAVLLRVEDGKGDLRFVAIPIEGDGKQP